MKLPRGESEEIAMTVLGKDLGPNPMKSPGAVKGELCALSSPGSRCHSMAVAVHEGRYCRNRGHLFTTDTAPKQNTDVSQKSDCLLRNRQ